MATPSHESTLIVMAAGRGRRYGGLKQLAAVGPGGETIMEYSIRDAFAAQFGKVVIVIQRESEAEFNARFAASRLASGRVEFVFQDADSGVPEFMRPSGRQRPWGTAHAVLCARHLVHGPFAVINADDYYGPSSLEMMGRFLHTHRPSVPAQSAIPIQGAMVGFRLSRTLSDHGAVSRGICQIDDRGSLVDVVERHKVVRRGNGGQFVDDDGNEQRVAGDEIVSMNLWGFPHSMLGLLEQRFHQFLDRKPLPTQEFEIPGIVQGAIDRGELQISVLKTEEPWCGLTYLEDLPGVTSRINSLIATGSFPQPSEPVAGRLAELGSVVAEFDIAGQFLEAVLIPQGHINTTYRIESESPAGRQNYVLQKINTNVFKNPNGLMKNISGVTRFLDQQLASRGMSVIERERHVLQVVPCSNGRELFHSRESGDWRMYRFISGAHPVDASPSIEEIYQAGIGFGGFIARLLEFPLHQLTETIPNFHHGPMRFKAFSESVAQDVMGRSASIPKEIKFIQSHQWLLGEPNGLVMSSSVPLRVTHNDTKSNNILLDDKTNEAVCVIDLDTVMPGLVLFDLGDLVRTTCSQAPEDAANLDEIEVEFDRLESAICGFRDAVGAELTEVEVRSLPMGPAYMALIMATRFITDYLGGDTYFHVDHPEHNLQRGRAQLRRTELLLDSMGAIERLLLGS